MKSKTTGCGSISAIFSSIVLMCVCSVIITIIIIIIEPQQQQHGSHRIEKDVTNRCNRYILYRLCHVHISELYLRASFLFCTPRNVVVKISLKTLLLSCSDENSFCCQSTEIQLSFQLGATVTK